MTQPKSAGTMSSHKIDIPAGPGHWITLFVCHLIFGVAITWLYLGMRGVMRLGGFVASGGPYEIAHPAPGWIWVLFAGAFGGIVAALVSFTASRRIPGPNLMILAWSALFISLGWNFLEFGLRPPVGEGVVWGWLICAFVFLPMGLLPLLFLILHGLRSRRRRLEIEQKLREKGDRLPEKKSPFPSVLFQLAAVAIGVYLGIHTFARISAGDQARGLQPARETRAFAPSVIVPSNAGSAQDVIRGGYQNGRFL